MHTLCAHIIMHTYTALSTVHGTAAVESSEQLPTVSLVAGENDH